MFYPTYDDDHIDDGCTGCHELQSRIEVAVSALVDAKFYLEHVEHAALQDAVARAAEALQAKETKHYLKTEEGADGRVRNGRADGVGDFGAVLGELRHCQSGATSVVA